MHRRQLLRWRASGPDEREQETQRLLDVRVPELLDQREDTAGVDLPALVCRSASRAASPRLPTTSMISGAEWASPGTLNHVLALGQRAGQRDQRAERLDRVTQVPTSAESSDLIAQLCDDVR